MDKKSVLIGLFFLIGGFVLLMYNSAQQQEAQRERLERQREAARMLQQEAEQLDRTDPEIVSAAASPRPRVSPDLVRPADAVPLAEAPTRVEEFVTLQNEHVRVRFSSLGGAVQSVTLLNYPTEVRGEEPVVLNGGMIPALAISRSVDGQLIPFAPSFQVDNVTDNAVTFSVTLSSGIVLRRTFELQMESGTGPQPYTISHRTEFFNPTDTAFNVDRIFLHIGTAAPTNADPMGFDLNASFLSRGNYRSIPASRFRDGGFIFRREAQERVERRQEITWGAVKNQFFTSILTPSTPAEAIIATGVRFPPELGARNRDPIGVSAALEFALPTLAPGESRTISADLYAGPKDFRRLTRLDQDQEDVMQLGWFLGMYLGFIAWIAKLMLTLMGAMYAFSANWGVAIILTTIVIRLLLWPLTAKAARASKRMQKLQKPIKELQEKYKDDPRKQQEAMLALWKKYKINPLSGCWPVLLQFPIFIAFFNLLRNSSDLRFANFLWIQDLSMPDATIGLGNNFFPLIGNAINVLPFLWLISMYYQMKLMPQPSLDNAQAKLIKWMPFIFFPFTYFFSSGLVLYWTTTNCFSIFQQYVTNRRRDEDDAKIEQEMEERARKSEAAAPTGPLIKKKKKKKTQD